MISRKGGVLRSECKAPIKVPADEKEGPELRF